MKLDSFKRSSTSSRKYSSTNVSKFTSGKRQIWTIAPPNDGKAKSTSSGNSKKDVVTKFPPLPSCSSILLVASVNIVCEVHLKLAVSYFACIDQSHERCTLTYLYHCPDLNVQCSERYVLVIAKQRDDSINALLGAAVGATDFRADQLGSRKS